MNINLSSISDKILEKVKSGQIKTRPRVYFVLRGIFFVLVIVFVGLATLYLASFILFSLQASGAWFLPAFGFGKMWIFLLSLPWFLILVAVGLIITLELLVKHFSFAYRKPVLYSILGVIVFAFLGSFVVAKSSLHPELFGRAREGKLPVIGGFYRGFGAPAIPQVHHGVVVAASESFLSLQTPMGEILKISIATTTCTRCDEKLEENDRAIVIGKRDDGTVQAVEIRRAESRLEMFRFQHQSFGPGHHKMFERKSIE